MGPRNAYKDMLDNVVSPITCVSMNPENQLEQMANGAMFATESTRQSSGSSGRRRWPCADGVAAALASAMRRRDWDRRDIDIGHAQMGSRLQRRRTTVWAERGPEQTVVATPASGRSKREGEKTEEGAASRRSKREGGEDRGRMKVDLTYEPHKSSSPSQLDTLSV
jgi:hypothetical protein